ncbi:MAG TPA: fatty acid hydroxylase family protein [Acidobacteria bacterium]|nr:fatty acid hydroxylase family protein [Acidobacteriota bacterium]
MTFVVFVVTFGLAFVCASLVEYIGHRLMHRGVLLAEAHRRHHADGRAKGVVWEFLHYVCGTLPLLPWGFFLGWAVGWGWLSAGVVYAFFSAYGHQLQHDRPEACFWMLGPPIHALHHLHDQQHCNFGLAVDWWDHLFGTWDPAGSEALPPRRPSWRGLISVGWLSSR